MVQLNTCMCRSGETDRRSCVGVLTEQTGPPLSFPDNNNIQYHSYYEAVAISEIFILKSHGIPHR